MGTRYGFVSTYPPTQCGLATFTAALYEAMTESGEHDGRVVALVDTALSNPAAEVCAQWVAGDARGMSFAAAQLNECDAVILQHEFGIYGGADGRDVLDLLDAVEVPCIVVLHTVLTDPTTHQRQILEAVADRAAALVTMSAVARDRLARGYRVDMGKVSVIAHGAPDLSSPVGAPRALFRGSSRTVLTWGLIGPGKGIEWGIQAMAELRDLTPAAEYIVAGQTHPKVLEYEGERYRDGLSTQIKQLGLGAAVRMDGRYLGMSALADLVAAADVVLLPYDSTDQVTSGVLIEAVAAGKPVVATRFPHAVELLGDGAGIVVPHQDPTAIAEALRTVLTRPEVAVAMSGAAAAAAPTLRWSAVARQYRELANRLALAVAA